MSKKTIIASLAILAVSSFSVTNLVHAYPGADDKQGEKYHQNHDNEGSYHNFKGHGKNRNKDGRGERLAEMHKQYDALSAEQKNELDKMTEKHRDAMNPIDTNLAIKHAEYKALMQNSNPNPKEAGRLAGDISKLQQQKQELREEFRDEVEAKFGLDLPMPKGRGHGMGAGMGHGAGRGMTDCPCM